jgi:hypothetical protein
MGQISNGLDGPFEFPVPDLIQQKGQNNRGGKPKKNIQKTYRYGVAQQPGNMKFSSEKYPVFFYFQIFSFKS